MRQTRYKVDLKHFQTYRLNIIDPGDIASINTKDHSTYIEVAWADPGSVIRKSIFSVAAYHEVLKWKGSDISRFNKDVGTMFKKGPRGSQTPDTEKVAIDRVMLVCQRENGVNVRYSDSDGFGCPGMMGLWDLHSSDTLNRVKCSCPVAQSTQTSALAVLSGRQTTRLRTTMYVSTTKWAQPVKLMGSRRLAWPP